MSTVDAIREAVLALARECDYEEGHTRQVARLALRLFDELSPLHELGDEERCWLEWGALLHDIGWIDGQRRHHKTALAIILADTSVPWDDRTRLIVASVARYHRRALPSVKHEHFASLDADDRLTVGKLAAILRVADGLDRTHTDCIQDLSCRIEPNRVVVRCLAIGSAEGELYAAGKKSDLFEQLFGRELHFDIQPATR